MRDRPAGRRVPRPRSVTCLVQPENLRVCLTHHSSLTGLDKLENKQKAYQNQCYAKNSLVPWGVQTRKYLEFVNLHIPSQAPYPCSEEQVALYTTWFSRTLKYVSVLNYISGLNHFLCLNGEPPIDYTNYVLKSTLKGISRRNGDEPQQARPILPDMLRVMFAELTDSRGMACRDIMFT